MKLKLFSILIGIVVSASVFAQAPPKMSFQAVIRNSSDALVASSSVSIRVSVLTGSVTGPSVYVETHTGTTNANGLLSLIIGDGTLVSGSISLINLASGTYF